MNYKNEICNIAFYNFSYVLWKVIYIFFNLYTYIVQVKPSFSGHRSFFLCVLYIDSCLSFQTRPATTTIPTRYNQRCCGSLCIWLWLMLFIPDQTSHNQSPNEIQSALMWFFVYFTLTDAFHSRPDQSQSESPRDTISAVVVLCVFYFNWCFSFQTRPVTTRVSTRCNQRCCSSLCIWLWLMLSFQTRPVTTRVSTGYIQRCCGSLCIWLWLMLSFQTRPVTNGVFTRYS